MIINCVTFKKLLTIRVFICYFIITAADEPLEGLLEVVIAGDVDERVDHGMRICKHVDPELILYQPGW